MSGTLLRMICDDLRYIIVYIVDSYCRDIARMSYD